MYLLRLLVGQIADEIVAQLLQDGNNIFGDADSGISTHSIARRILLRTHRGEEQYFLNVALARHQHYQAVDAYTDARGGRHPILQSAQEVLVDEHGFVVALLAEAELILEALLLIDRVVELGICVGQFLTIDHQLETLGQGGIIPVLLRQRTHLDGVIRDECGLNKGALAKFAEDLVDKFAFAHRFVDLHLQFFADGAYLVFILAGKIVARLFADGFEDRQAAVRRFETDGLAVDNRFRRAVNRNADALKQTFGEAHHPIVIFILDVEFHTRKLGVVVLVHTLVAEVLANLVDAFEAAHDEPLQVKLGRDTQIQINVERVVMRDERPRTGAARDRLQDGRLYLHIAGFIECVAQSLDSDGALSERLLHIRVNDEVYITLAVAQFGV